MPDAPGKLRVSCYGLSLDGYGAGPNQSLENPMGVGGMALHEWIFPTNFFRKMHQEMGEGSPLDLPPAGETGIDNDFAIRGMSNLGAWILGRNMFGPIRNNWPDENWKGWWGPNPPYHCPVFVLTHYPRAPLAMEGGTTFYFVTDGIESALKQARAAAKDKDIRIGGGANTIRQYLRAKLIDEMHLAVSPKLLGAGEPLLADMNLPALGYKICESTSTPAATHIVISRI